MRATTGVTVAELRRAWHAIEAGNFTPCKDIHHTHEGSIGNLCNDKIEELMNHTLSEFHFERMENAEKELLK